MKTNGQTPTHPCTIGEQVMRGNMEGYAPVDYPGLTKREAFAMNAPEPHPSFDWDDPQDQAAVNALRDEMLATMPRQNAEDNGFLNKLESWHRDPCYDLVADNPAEQATIEAFIAAREKWVKARTEQNQNHPVKQRAAWARAYADALLAELELEPKS